MKIIYNEELSEYNISKIFTTGCLSGWQPRKKRFLTCNRKLEFYPDKIEAYSYGNWNFCRVFEGKIYLNMYYYSVTTACHQKEIYWMLDRLNIPFIVLDTIKDLRKDVIKESGINFLYKEYFNLLFKLRTRIFKKTRKKILKDIILVKDRIRLYKSYGLNIDKITLNKTFNFIKEEENRSRLYKQYSKFFNNMFKYRMTLNSNKKTRITKNILKIKNEIRYIKEYTSINKSIINHLILVLYRNKLRNIENSKLIKILS